MTNMREREPVDVRVVDVRRPPSGGSQPSLHVVILEREDGQRLLVWMREFEGTAIALALEKVEHPRPLTYPFMAKLLDATDSRLREVRITKLEHDTFFAIASVQGPQGITAVDARPSDAIALAMLTGAPIRVDLEVFEAQTAALHAAHADSRFTTKRLKETTEGAGQIAADAKRAWSRGEAAAPEGD